jgi:hypothetical protein
MILQLPPNYRVKPEDVRFALEAYFVRQDATKEELAIADTIFNAQEMHDQTGVWPTLAEADAYGWKKADAYWQKHFGKDAPR